MSLCTRSCKPKKETILTFEPLGDTIKIFLTPEQKWSYDDTHGFPWPLCERYVLVWRGVLRLQLPVETFNNYFENGEV